MGLDRRSGTKGARTESARGDPERREDWEYETSIKFENKEAMECFMEPAGRRGGA